MQPENKNVGDLLPVELISRAEQLVGAQQQDAAMELYHEWIRTSASPLTYVAYFNLGVLYASRQDRQRAAEMYQKALECNPDLIQARLNYGTTLEQLGQIDEALQQWRLALSAKDVEKPHNKPLLLSAYNNLGRLLEVQRQFKPALEMLEKSLARDPSQRDVILHYIHLTQKICRWPIYAPPRGVQKKDLIEGTSPLAMLAAMDDPEMQLAAARRFIRHKFNIADQEPLAPAEGYGHDKIRIGYLSSDLSMHAVSLLTVELYERHDRSRFEVYGFCWSKEDGTQFRQRIINGFDHFIKIGGMTDHEAAACIRSHEIDILIDLQGLTSGARPLILAQRPAPVQATYLGFPGTTGLPWIDYVIADRYMIPEEERPHYSETPIYLPNCFQVSDSHRDIGVLPTRARYNLPEDAFVFCSFNNNYKYTPDVFAAWMRILKRVPNSVLWLLADNEWAQDNLLKAAKKQGIRKERLIFAPRVAPADYLARYQIADLFLDTYPFNGGTTANDALFMGLPLLTLSGRTFASRYAGSLLTNLQVPELITTTLNEYENMAVALAEDREKYAALKARLDENRKTGPVFDTARFVADYEEALAAVLAMPRQESASRQDSSTKLYMIAYSPETLERVRGGFLLLDNLKNPRPDWMEYWPIREHLLAGRLDDQTMVGFFSPKFTEKTGLTHGRVLEFVAGCGEEVDVITFSPQPDMGAFFLSVFEQGDTFDPGFKAIAQQTCDALGLNIQLDSLIMDSRHVVFSNYFVARKRFWDAWLSVCERIFALCEERTTELAEALCAVTSYGHGVPRKVFLIERIASLLLASGTWKTRAYDTFKCAWSGTPLNNFKHEAVVSDALKMAYNDSRHGEYLEAFSEVRSRLFAQTTPN